MQRTSFFVTLSTCFLLTACGGGGGGGGSNSSGNPVAEQPLDLSQYSSFSFETNADENFDPVSQQYTRSIKAYQLIKDSMFIVNNQINHSEKTLYQSANFQPIAEDNSDEYRLTTGGIFRYKANADDQPTISKNTLGTLTTLSQSVQGSSPISVTLEYELLNLSGKKANIFITPTKDSTRENMVINEPKLQQIATSNITFPSGSTCMSIKKISYNLPFISFRKEPRNVLSDVKSVDEWVSIENESIKSSNLVGKKIVRTGVWSGIQWAYVETSSSYQVPYYTDFEGVVMVDGKLYSADYQGINYFNLNNIILHLNNIINTSKDQAEKDEARRVLSIFDRGNCLAFNTVSSATIESLI
jgi:hypothetical protein